MADISKITLPSGNTYDIKDKVARDMISGGISFEIVWTATNYAQTSAPSAATLATIPNGVTIYYNNGASSSTGTLTASADTKAKFYLIYSKTQAGILDRFDEYVTIETGGDPTTYVWEKIGDTLIDLSNVVTNVTLNKQTASAVTGYSNSPTDEVLGSGTTFTNAASSVTFTGGTNDKVLGEATTFALTSGSVTHGTLTGHTDEVLGSGTTFSVTQPTITVTPSTTNIKATASGTAVGANGTAAAITGFGTHTTDTFVKSVTVTQGNKLVTTTVPNVTGNTSVSIPNVTDAGSASTWSFTMGSGEASETLIIGGANSVAPTLGENLTATNTTLGTAKTVATGAASSSGTGAALVTGVKVGDSAAAITALGTPTTSNCLTGVKVTSQPTIALATGATAGTGVISVATGISSANATGTAVTPSGDMVDAIVSMPTSTVGTGITVGTNDKVTAITGIGTGTAAAQTITVGTNDKVNALTGLGTKATATVLTDATTLDVTKGNS